jgi:NitT/TauT family transport system permease protein
LGAMIDSARTQQRLDLVFGALILLSVMGIFCLAVLKALHVWLQKIRPYGLQLKD